MSFYSKPQTKFQSELSQRLESTDGVIYLAADVTETQGYLVIAPGTSQEEIVKYTSQATGLVSGAVRGLSTVGTAETAGTGKVHSAGTPVEMRNVHYYWARSIDALNGVSATSANIFAIGENVATASAITTTKGVFHYFGTSASSAMAGIGLSSNGFAVWTDDQGTNWHRLSATGGAITGGDGITNTGGTLSVDVADLISATAGISSISDNFSVNEAWDPTWTGDHDYQGNVSATGTFFGINTTTWGISGTQISATGDNLNTLVGGSTSFADSLHTHKNDYDIRRRHNFIGNWSDGTTISLSTAGKPLTRGFFDTDMSTSGVGQKVGISAIGDFEWDNIDYLRFSCVAKLDEVTDAESFMGLITSAFVPNWGVTTASHIGFATSASILYATMADGSTQDTTNISAAGATLTEYNHFEFELTGGAVTFTVNGTSSVTMSTTVPTSAHGADLTIGVGSRVSAARGMNVNNNYSMAVEVDTYA